MSQKCNRKDTWISMAIALLMAIVGGYLDIYTYLARGKVFANTQTGNLVLLGYNIAECNLKKVLYYILPITAFMLGVGLAELIEHKWKETEVLRWLHISLAIEIIVLFGVMWIPEGGWNIAANISVSFVCGLQVQTFRKVNGVSYSTTMFTGNLKNAAERLSNFAITRETEAIQKGAIYCAIIAMFILGAVIGDLVTSWLKQRAVGVINLLLCLVFVLLYFEKQRNPGVS